MQYTLLLQGEQTKASHNQKMAAAPIFISEENVANLLEWNLTYDAVETSLRAISDKTATQNPRGILRVPGTNNVLYSMPGYVNHVKFGALACKLVTNFPENECKESGNVASVNANILLFDEATGILKAVSTIT